MANVPFPRTLMGSANLPRTKQGCQNCWINDAGHPIGRPGINGISTTLGVARGSFEWNGGLYAVTGPSLIKMDNFVTGTYSTIGAIAGSADIQWDIGFNDAVIVVPGGAIYTLSTSDVLKDISGEPNFAPCVDVAVIAGIFVYIPADGGPAFFSDVGDAESVQATSFIDAESLTDKNKAVINLRDTLIILGENSIEPYTLVPASLVPFRRIARGRLDYGYIGGLQEYGDTFTFIGRAKGQAEGIYAYSPGVAQKISVTRIDETLHNDYTLVELAEAVPGRIVWSGYDIMTLTLRGDSYGFIKGQWFLLDTVINDVSRPWSGGFIAQFRGDYFSFHNDKFGQFKDINTDYGNRITRMIDLGFNNPTGERFTCNNAELGVSQGFNSGAGSVALFMSRNNMEFPIPIYRNLGVAGEYNKRLVWNPPGGLGNYTGFMGMRLYTTENINFDSDSLIVNLS